ncbi:hypothetical protein [Jiella sp. M17.18]|uniref:hypothetical protein n=1 Tax=Jiella sp. M17.18 TaxID=3234247 RepID=UPI0034DE6E9E
MPPSNYTAPTQPNREPDSSAPPSATILSVDTAALVGAALRLGRRRLSRLERQRLLAQLKAHAAAGDATARMTIDWLACRPDRLLAPKGEA